MNNRKRRAPSLTFEILLFLKTDKTSKFLRKTSLVTDSVPSVLFIENLLTFIEV